MRITENLGTSKKEKKNVEGLTSNATVLGLRPHLAIPLSSGREDHRANPLTRLEVFFQAFIGFEQALIESNFRVPRFQVIPLPL